jgi:hypothetical protein
VKSKEDMPETAPAHSPGGLGHVAHPMCQGLNFMAGWESSR